MRTTKMPRYFITLLIAVCFSARAQDQTALQQKLVSEYALTQPTAANDDIVSAGAVLVLKKDNLITSPVSSRLSCQNTYKDGRITQPRLGILTCNHHPTDANPSRIFVAGEKMWVTKIDIKPDGVFFDLFTDPYNDARYRASLKFPFAKGSMPSSDQVERLVAEVFSVQPADGANAKGQQQGPPRESQGAPAHAQPLATPSAPPPQAEAPPPPIPPPPPPPADPKTIALKQTTDQVVASFGQPEKIIKLGTKEIYVYKDMKVTFVAGKVTDVQ